MFQHEVCVGLNLLHVVIGSESSLPVEGTSVAGVASHVVSLEGDQLEAACEMLREYAKPLCKTAGETELPPLRAINHSIPLIDEGKVYLWCPSRCPEAFSLSGGPAFTMDRKAGCVLAHRALGNNQRL